MPLQHQIPVLILLAGTNDPSNSALLAEHFTDGLRETEGIHAEMISLRELDLPHFTLKDYELRASHTADYHRLKTAVERARGIVIVSPIWNFSVPAHLKNAIDHLGIFALDPETRTRGLLKRTPFRLIFTGGAGVFAWKSVMQDAISHVREAMKYFGATHMGTHFEPKCVKQPERTFALVVDERPETLALMKRQGRDFGELVKKFTETGQLPAVNAGKSLFYRVASWFAKRFT